MSFQFQEHWLTINVYLKVIPMICFTECITILLLCMLHGKNNMSELIRYEGIIFDQERRRRGSYQYCIHLFVGQCLYCFTNDNDIGIVLYNSYHGSRRRRVIFVSTNGDDRTSSRVGNIIRLDP